MTPHQTQVPLIQNEQELLMRLRAVEGYLSTVQKEMTFQQKIETAMSSLKNRHEISASLSSKISSVRWKIIKTEWLDAAKQGLMTAIFLVPFYLIIRLITSLANIDFP